MPIYEYKCQRCGETYAVFQKTNDKPLKICKDKKCGGELEKLISLSNFKINGYSEKNNYSKPPNKK